MLTLSNFASSTLAQPIDDNDLQIDVQTGDGDLFPDPAVVNYMAVIENSVGTKEIVRVTGKSVDAFTVSRAAEGTTAAAFVAGSRFELRLTAGYFDEASVDGGTY